MYVANADGVTVAFYPERNEKGESTIGMDFSDRPYFQKMKSTMRPVMSEVFRDNTERKKIEEKLQNAQKLESIGVLAGGIAHDFNNLLAAVIGNISLAKVERGDALVERLEEIEKASLRAKDLTGQLLTFSKGGAPIRKTFSLVDLIRHSATFVTRGSNVRCAFRIAPDLKPVDADEGLIGQVINNLVIDAMQAMPDGGVIRIVAENIRADEALRRTGLHGDVVI